MTTREADRPLQRYLVSARPVSSATDKPTPPPGTRPIERLDDPIDLAAAPQDLLDVMRVALRVFDPDYIKKNTGMTKERATILLKRIGRKFNIAGDFLRAEEDRLFAKERALIDVLTRSIAAKSAYSSNELEEELIDLLIKLKFLGSDEIDSFIGIQPHISLFCLATFHGAKFIMPDGNSVVGKVGWEPGVDGTPLLSAKTEFTIPARALGRTFDMMFSMPLFSTNLKAENWVEGFDGSDRYAWDIPIEVTSSLRLAAIH